MSHPVNRITGKKHCLLSQNPHRILCGFALLISWILFTFGSVPQLLSITSMASAQTTSSDTIDSEQNRPTRDDAASADLLDMSLEELMQVEVGSSASLTSVSPRLAPAAVTTITAEDIQAAGARSLFELLDIYVPNLQWRRHNWEADVMGLRGIMGDRDDKYLLLVNGVMMNERTHYGALTEKDLVHLKDIHHIDIVRGPGSSLYGPGAVSMVINITTFNSDTFQGTDITTRAGIIEEFYSTEIRHGRQFNDGGGGLFLYLGIGKYNGATTHDAPQIYGFDFPTESNYSWWNPDWGVNTGPAHLPGDGTRAGDPMLGIGLNNDGESHRGVPPMKLYTEIKREDWTFWGRYTLGGKQMVWENGVLARDPYGWADWVQPLQQQGYGYQQATLFAGKNTELSDNATLDTSFSYTLTDTEIWTQDALAHCYREDRYQLKAIYRREINDHHKIALGGELAHNELGLDSLAWPQNGDSTTERFSGNQLDMPQWSTNLVSAMGEHQWTLSDQWTTFISARIDKHTYTDPMFSPRGALIYTPTEKDTLKWIWARSVRSNFEEEMKVANMLDGATDSAPEKLDSLEFRYERKCNDRFDVAVNPFVHYNLELMGYSDASASVVNVGTQRDYGLDLEAYYHTQRTRLGLSHGFTKLYDFNLGDNADTLISAYPYGYGKDLTLWSNHITKLTAHQQLNDQWTLDGSMRVYWGFPGLKDYNEYRYASTGGLAPVEPDWQRGYRGNYYLNLGLQYQPIENLTCRIDGYNLLGLFNDDFNKRNYLSSGAFRSHATAIGLSLAYRF